MQTALTGVTKPRPAWIENPSVIDEDRLCDVCRHIDFKFLVKNRLSPKDAIELGLLHDILRKDWCAFCRMVVRAISITCKINLLEKLEHEVKDTFCELTNYYKTARGGDSTYSLDIMMFGDNVMMFGDNITSVFIHCLADEKSSRPGEGRLVSRYQVEISQIKNWLHTCEHVHSSGDSDRLNKMTTRDLFLRVIDVKRKCVVKAPQECRYIALSYVWG